MRDQEGEVVAIDEDALLEIAQSRPGFELLACTPVALPFWRLRVRVEVLARRAISPLEEFMMRAASETDPATQVVQALLGLDDETFESVLTSVVEREWANVKNLQIRLSDAGKEALENARWERSEERVVSFDYDGLLRTPALLEVPLEPEQRRAAGLHELPANPPSAPDELELRDRAEELQEVIRKAREGRDQEADLLAVKGVLRRERVFRDATLAVFRDESGEVQAAPVIDGAVSGPHEAALADPAVRRQLRLTSELRRGRRFDQLIAPELRALHRPAEEKRARELRTDARRLQQAGKDAENARRAAASAMRAAAVRSVGPEEHPRLIHVMAAGAKSRLLIATALVTAPSVDRELLKAIRGLLNRGGEVKILHSMREELPGALRTLAEDHEGLELRQITSPPFSTVIRDETLALRTLMPVLAYRGHERPFRDERGWLVNDREHVQILAGEMLAAAPRNAEKKPAPRR